MKNTTTEQHYKAPLYTHTHSSPAPGLMQIILFLSFWKGFPDMSPENNKGGCDDQRQEITFLYVMPKQNSRTSQYRNLEQASKRLQIYR